MQRNSLIKRRFHIFVMVWVKNFLRNGIFVLPFWGKAFQTSAGGARNTFGFFRFNLSLHQALPVRAVVFKL